MGLAGQPRDGGYGRIAVALAVWQTPHLPVQKQSRQGMRAVGFSRPSSCGFAIEPMPPQVGHFPVSLQRAHRAVEMVIMADPFLERCCQPSGNRF
jgi:hypothetical protein